MAQSAEYAPPHYAFLFIIQQQRAQFELGGGRPLASVTSDCWRVPKLLRNTSAEQSGREPQTMEWRRWNTRVGGGTDSDTHGVCDVFATFLVKL